MNLMALTQIDQRDKGSKWEVTIRLEEWGEADLPITHTCILILTANFTPPLTYQGRHERREQEVLQREGDWKKITSVNSFQFEKKKLKC